MNPEVFREYDIRGIADRDLTDEGVVRLGRAVATRISPESGARVVVGRDVRLSSGRLRDRLVEGLLASGCHVTDLGECPTPLLYYGLHQLPVDGGVMITGSHNPAEYNGFKVSVGKASLHGEQIQELKQLMDRPLAEGRGRQETLDLMPAYRETILSQFDAFPTSPRVVVDCGNGTAALGAADLYRDLGCEVFPIFCEPDGRFPNHHPDPTVEEFLQDLIAEVQRRDADLGIAFDGDSDRIGVVDASGRILWGDELMILYARQILETIPGSTFIAEVKCSKRLYDDIEQRGGRAVMWKAGHSLIKAKMKEESAVLAGEMSGHMFFADRYFGYDDAFYAGARLLEICARSSKSPAELLADLPPSFNTPEIRVDCPEEIKFELVRRAQEFFSSRYEAVTVDGVRVVFDDGWGLVRASNTQPVLVLRFEAESPSRLAEIRSLIEAGLSTIRAEVENDRK